MNKDNWTTVTIKDVAVEVRDRVDNPSESGYERFVGLSDLESGELVVRNWGSTSDVKSAMKLFKSGDVLFARRNAYLKRASVARFDGLCSGDAIVLREKTDVIVKGYLPLILNTNVFWDYALAHASGSMSKRVKSRDLFAYEFTLPPLDEQRRIAEILWAVEDTIEEYHFVLSEMIKTIEITTAKLMRDGIVHHDYAESKIGLIPASWDLVILENVSEVTYGLTVNSKRRRMKSKKPYLRVGNIYRNKIDLSEIKEIGATDKGLETYCLNHKDILVVEGHADTNEIGRAALWENQIDECLHQNHILRVRCSAKAVPYFVMSYINSPRGRRYFQRMAKSTSGLNTINSTVLKKMPLPLPSVNEQEEIANILLEMHNNRLCVQEHISRLNDLKKRLLGKLLDQNNLMLVS